MAMRETASRVGPEPLSQIHLGKHSAHAADAWPPLGLRTAADLSSPYKAVAPTWEAGLVARRQAPFLPPPWPGTGERVDTEACQELTNCQVS